MDNGDEGLFSCWLEEKGETRGFIQEFFARAPHLGEAIPKVLRAAKEQGFKNPVLFQCDPVELEGDAEGLEPSPSAEVFWSAGKIFFDLDPADPEPSFIFPWGVIPSPGGFGEEEEGEVDESEIAPGFDRSADDDGIEYLEVNVSGPELFPLYGRLLQLHPNFEVFWYVLHGHWMEGEGQPEEGEDEFLVNEALSTADKIVTHLQTQMQDSVQNGFVTLTAYLEEGETNLSISDHKRILVISKSSSVVDGYQKALEEAGLRLVPKLASIDAGVHHWHYRLQGSRTKEELAQSLLGSGFRIWDR